MTTQNQNQDLTERVITTETNHGIYSHSSGNEFYQPSPSEKCKRILYNDNGKQEISESQELNKYHLRK